MADTSQSGLSQIVQGLFPGAGSTGNQYDDWFQQFLDQLMKGQTGADLGSATDPVRRGAGDPLAALQQTATTVPPTSMGPDTLGSNIQNQANQMLAGQPPTPETPGSSFTQLPTQYQPGGGSFVTGPDINAPNNGPPSPLAQLTGPTGSNMASPISAQSGLNNVTTQPGRQPKIGGSPVSGVGIGSGIYGPSLGQGSETKAMMDKVGTGQDFILGLDPTKDYHSPDAVWNPAWNTWVGGTTLTADQIQKAQAELQGKTPGSGFYRKGYVTGTSQ
jgi:hypothetical protein